MLATSACAGPSSDPPSTSVRDSAGITIIESATPDFPASERLRVTADPVLTIGELHDGGPAAFTRVAGVTRLADGTIVVLDVQTAELRFFDAAGQHVRTVGGRGDGPGELRAPRTLARTRGDTLAVWDAVRRALELFDTRGEQLARRSMIDMQAFPDVDFAAGCVSGLPVLADGSVLRCIREEGLTRDAVSTPPEGLVRSVVRLVAIRPQLDRLDTLGIHYRQFWLLHLGNGAIGDGGHPFLSQAHLAVGRDAALLYSTNGPDYSIAVWDTNGRLSRIVRRRDAVRAPTDDEAARAWDIALKGVPANLQDRVRSAVEPVTRLLPAIHGLVAGPAGELWVRRTPAAAVEGPTHYDVIDPTGRYLGTLSLPREFELVEVGDDYLLGTRVDDLDVPYVQVYALERM